MARRRPDGIDKGVVEHRITLGDYERREMRQLVKSQIVLNRINTGTQIGKGVLVGGAAAGTAYVLYESYRLCREWLSSSPVLDAANDMASRLIAAGLDPLKPSPVPLGIRIAWKGFEKTLERVVLGESPAEKWRRYSEGQD
jgi:hypothetical protein